MDKDQQNQQQLMAMQSQMLKSLTQQAMVCVNKCLIKPGKSLSSSESQCLEHCPGRITEAQQFMVERLKAFAEKEADKQGLHQ